MHIEDWGLCAYKDAYTRMCTYRDERINDSRKDTLVLCEHTPVYTFGTQSHEENLRISLEECAQKGIEIHHIERGGDITYHGPGQLVAYPIIKLPKTARNVKLFVRLLEEVVLDICKKLHIPARRIKDMTGVWLAQPENAENDALPWHNEKKLASIGIAFSRWVSYHGVALNVTDEIENFSYIHLCGLKGKEAASLSGAANKKYTVKEINPLFCTAFTHYWRQFCHGNYRYNI